MLLEFLLSLFDTTVAGVICQSETGDVGPPSGESVTEPAAQTVKPFDERSMQPSEVQSFLPWKSRLSHMQRLRHLRWIPPHKLKRASPRKKKDGAKVKYKVKTPPEERATMHAAGSSGLNARLLAMLTDDSNKSAWLRTTGEDTAPSCTFSSANASTVLIPDTHPPCLPGPPAQLQTSSEQIIGNIGNLPNDAGLSDPETSSNGAISDAPSSRSISIYGLSEAAAPTSNLHMRSQRSELAFSTPPCETPSSIVASARKAADRPLCSSASSLPFTVQDSSTSISQTTDMPGGADMPRPMDVDIPSNVDSGFEEYSDFEGCTVGSGSEDDQERPDISESATYRWIKRQAVS